MNKHAWMIFSALVAAALPWAACGGNTTTGGTTGGTGGHTTTHSTTSSHTTTSSNTSSTSSTSSTLDCTNGPFGADCETCVETSCCALAATCYNDSNCNDCLMNTETDPTTCEMGMTPNWDAFFACLNTSCNAPCIPHSSCNPITNAECTAMMAGAACDLDQTGVFSCFMPPNDATLCTACDNVNGPFCQGTMHCIEDSNMMNGQCTRFCCTDGDCGDGGTCDTTQLTEGVGLCMGMVDAAVDPACASPMVAPSGGSCFTGFSDGGTGDAGPG